MPRRGKPLTHLGAGQGVKHAFICDSLRPVQQHSFAEQESKTGEQFIQGPRATPCCVVPCYVCDFERRVRTMGVCSNLGNDIDRGFDDALGVLLKSKVRTPSPSMTGHHDMSVRTNQR